MATKTSLAIKSSRYLYFFDLLCDYSNSYNLFNVAEPCSKRTGGKGVQVETENEKFGVVRRRNVPKFYNSRVAEPLFLSLNAIVL